MMTYKGFFRPKNDYKYIGTLPIIYRSSWELALMKWCDENINVIKWGSESVIVPYLCEVDQKQHRYYIDFNITFKNKETYLIEVKPKSQIQIPSVPKNGKKTKYYVQQILEYSKNCSKWKAAKKYANENGYHFQVWTEEVLKKLGIPIF